MEADHECYPTDFLLFNELAICFDESNLASLCSGNFVQHGQFSNIHVDYVLVIESFKDATKAWRSLKNRCWTSLQAAPDGTTQKVMFHYMECSSFCGMIGQSTPAFDVVVKSLGFPELAPVSRLSKTIVQVQGEAFLLVIPCGHSMCFHMDDSSSILHELVPHGEAVQFGIDRIGKPQYAACILEQFNASLDAGGIQVQTIEVDATDSVCYALFANTRLHFVENQALSTSVGVHITSKNWAHGYVIYLLLTGKKKFYVYYFADRALEMTLHHLKLSPRACDIKRGASGLQLLHGALLESASAISVMAEILQLEDTAVSSELE